jgi:hypothetical protein
VNAKEHILRDIQKAFPEVRLPAESELLAWLDEAVPTMVRHWLISARTLKVCGGVSPDFAEIAAAHGFPVVTVSAPGHFYNVALTQEAALLIDLSAAQFEVQRAGLCDFDVDELEGPDYQHLLNVFERIERDPFSAVRIERIDPRGIGSYRTPTGSFPSFLDPVAKYKRNLRSPPPRQRNPLTLATALKYEKHAEPRWPAKELVAIMKKAARLLDVEVEDHLLGCGVFGCVVPVKGRKTVLKVSQSGRELSLVQSLVTLGPRAAPGFVRIAKGPVVMGPDPNQDASDYDPFANRLFAYVREEVEPMDHGAPPRVRGFLAVPAHWPSFLSAASNAAEDGRSDDYLEELDLFTEPYLKIAATMRRLFEKENILVRDALPTNMGWRKRGSDRVLVVMDADAYAPAEEYPEYAEDEWS